MAEEIEHLVHPLIKEILEQQRMILEMHKPLLDLLSHPPIIYHSKEVSKNISLK